MTQTPEFTEPRTVTPSREPEALAKIKNDLLLEASLAEPELYLTVVLARAEGVTPEDRRASMLTQRKIAMGIGWRLEEGSPLPDSDVRILIRAGANIDPVAIAAAVEKLAEVVNRDFRKADVMALRSAMLAQQKVR